MKVLKGRVCVFAGSLPGGRADYAGAAREMGLLLAARGYGVVYGGGGVGLMKVLADAVLESHGHVIGVIPQALVERELAHHGLPELRVVGSMHERKAVMADLADGFIALPGGLGTIEEFFEVWTWAQLGIHNKPCGLLNVEDYYREIVGFVDHAVDEGFLDPVHRASLIVEAQPSALIDSFERFAPPQVTRWLKREEA